MSITTHSPYERSRRNFLYIARLSTIIFLIASFLYIYFGVIYQSWTYLLAAGAYIVSTGVSIYSRRLGDIKESYSGAWSIILATIVVVLITSSVQINVSSEVGLTSLIAILLIAIQTLPPDQTLRGAILGALTSLLCGALGFISPLPQTTSVTADLIITWIARGSTITFLLLLIIQYRTLALASKLMTAFLGVLVVISLTFSIVMTATTSQTMTTQVGQGMQALAESRSLLIGDIVSGQVENLQTLALNESIQAGVTTSNSYYTDDETQDLNNILSRDQEWRNAFENSTTNPYIDWRLNNATADDLVRYRELSPINIETFVTDRKGAVVGANNLTTDYYQADEEWWQVAFNEGQGDIYIGQPVLDESTQIVGISIAVPMYNEISLKVEGIIHTTFSANSLLETVQGVDTAESSAEIDIIFPGEPAKQLHDGILENAEAIVLTHIADLEQSNEFYATTIYEGENSIFTSSTVRTVSGLPVVKNLGWKTVIHQNEEEVLAPVRGQVRLVSFFGTILAGIAALLSLIVAQRLARPITDLTEIANKVIEGDLAARASVASRDEIGQLANTFNTMTSQLQETLHGLEERVAERTTDLEKSSQKLERRAGQFEAVAQLARTITSIQDLDILLPRITQLVSELFGFYHAGLFLLDESRQFAVLSAANSEGGQRMLERRHSLEVGKSGIVGFVTATGNPRIALDAGADAVFFDNPDLPETRSEMALPLHVGNQIVGALDVQSTEPNAFSEDDVEVLSILADEVSIAIENARLHEESQRLLADAQSAFTDFTREAWQNLSKSSEVIGYKLSGSTIRSLDKPIESDGSTLAIPIKLRDQIIGTVNINLPENKELDPDEADITQAMIDRVGAAVETAALLEETRRRALKEQAIGEITSKIGSSINMRNVLQTAVEELGRALPGSEVIIQFTDQDGSGGSK